MDKKTKKRIDVLTERLKNRQQQLVGATKQLDEPEEVVQLTREIELLKEEIRQLREKQ